MDSMDPSAMKAMQDAVVKDVWELQLVSYFHVISIALLVYDTVLTTGLELQYIWRGRWNWLKLLYVAQRYLPFFDTAFMVAFRQFLSHPDPEFCHTIYLTSNWTFTAGIALSEMLLSFRVWVVWQRSKVMAIVLPCFFLGCWVPALYIVYEVFSTLEFGYAPFEPHTGCFVSAGGKREVYICWLLLLAYEAGLLMLMLISASHIGGPRAASQSLAGVVHRDGISYYIYLFILSLANVIVILLLPSALGELLCSLERVTYSILTSRVVLHIREHADNARIVADVPSLHFSDSKDAIQSEGNIYQMQSFGIQREGDFLETISSDEIGIAL
ncbi:hypothetical protein C8J56DRAFT_922470 [Mycena floridula]|nr:hypothetical protein C8J56DRAFT_922470 [Mycena floridula]